jgi:transcriptional regulator with XRE-family HTH domain
MREPIDQYIIDKVIEIRKKLKITQLQLAFALGYKSVGYIGAIESLNPKRVECYNTKQLNKIAVFLKCSPKDFWPEEPISSYTSERLEKKLQKQRVYKKKTSKTVKAT